MTGRKQRVAIVDRDLRRALIRGVTLQSHFEPTIVQSAHPLRDAAVHMRSGTDALLTLLDGSCSVVDVRELLGASPATPILFLAELMPVRATVARLIGGTGHAVMPLDASDVVVQATLIALLAEWSRTHA
jgi:hypothetical protein